MLVTNSRSNLTVISVQEKEKLERINLKTKNFTSCQLAFEAITKGI